VYGDNHPEADLVLPPSGIRKNPQPCPLIRSLLLRSSWGSRKIDGALVWYDCQNPSISLTTSMAADGSGHNSVNWRSSNPQAYSVSKAWFPGRFCNDKSMMMMM
jgi:hypothetical protein